MSAPSHQAKSPGDKGGAGSVQSETASTTLARGSCGVLPHSFCATAKTTGKVELKLSMALRALVSFDDSGTCSTV